MNESEGKKKADARSRLRADHRSEQHLFWKGVLALVVVIAVVAIRQWLFV